MFDLELGQSQSYMSSYVLGPSLSQVQHILKVAAESVGKFLNATLWDIGEAASDLSVTVLHSKRGGGTPEIRAAFAQNRVDQVETDISQCIQARAIGHPLFWNCLGLVVITREVRKFFRHSITDGTPRTNFNIYESWVTK